MCKVLKKELGPVIVRAVDKFEIEQKARLAWEKYLKKDPCRSCGGKGRHMYQGDAFEEECRECGGTGKRRHQKGRGGETPYEPN